MSPIGYNERIKKAQSAEEIDALMTRARIECKNASRDTIRKRHRIARTIRLRLSVSP